MKKSDYIFIFVLVILVLPLPTTAKHDVSGMNPKAMASHELLMDPITWDAFGLQCTEGETLSGTFVVTQDGSLFIGDDTRYEYWLLEGIDFFICNATSYESWVSGEEIDPLFMREDVSELDWSVIIPSTGEWYIVYWNDTIFMKTLEGNFARSSEIPTPVIAMVLVVGAIGLILLLGLMARSIRS